MRDKRGFTLFEILISIVVIGIISTAIGGAFVSLFLNWQKQRDALTSFENARWALEYMSNELRHAKYDSLDDSATGIFNDHEILNFVRQGNSFWYWIGKSSGSNDFGDPNTIYRGQGNTINDANSNRKELARFIVNDSAYEFFNVTDGGTTEAAVILELISRPRPAEAEGKGNRNWVLQTRIRPQN
jgi:prepilin-type N-terminal cleavage/methylation domain-containing protein